MKYALIELQSFPKILFSHTYETETYNFHHSQQLEYAEISYYEAGTAEKNDGKNVKYYVPGSVSIEFPGKEFSQKCTSCLHRHLTVGFSAFFAQNYISEEEIIEKYSQSESDGASVFGKKQIFIIPESVLPGKNAETVHKLLLKIQETYAETDKIIQPSVCAGLIMTLLSEITAFTLEEILNGRLGSRERPSDMVYMKMFYRYVNAHINENISCADIAAEMGITQGYLSKIVADETGQSPKTKINYMKLEKVADICRIQGLAFSEAGRIVGFKDAHYLSRLFKKYYGMSYREYLKSPCLLQ